MAITDAEGLHGVGTELVTNGTFDSATTGWTAGNTATLALAENGQSGTVCLKVIESGGANPYATQNAGALTAGKQYSFSYWVKAGDEATFRAYVSDGTYNFGENSVMESTTDWTKYSTTFTAPSTVANAIIILLQSCANAAGTYIYFDSVSLVEVAQWKERETVPFTAGTLSTIDDCVTEVESKLKRGTLSTTTTPTTTQVKDWLIRGKEELAEIKNFTWTRRFAYVATTTSVWRYGLPSDYHGGEVFLRDLTNDKNIPIWPDIGFNADYPDPAGNTNAEPKVACIRGRELWLNCPANGAYTYELEYNRSGDDNIATDFSYIPEIDRFRICDFAVMESFLSLHQWDAAKVYADKWGFNMQKAKVADGKQKWKGMRYHAPLWFS